jgi:SAM-dependent methyltransferase
VKPEVELYNKHYGNIGAEAEIAVRRETWDEDVGQSSWITVAEAREWFRRLELRPGKSALEVACGSGGMTCQMAIETGATCTGVDINASGIEAATARARERRLEVTFREVDAGQRLPFDDHSFDAIFCNDSINHFPARAKVFRDWHRVLRPGGRLLVIDPIVVTGQLTGDEMRDRSSIGYFVFTPLGHNERLLAECGFTVLETRDVTEAVATISRKWRVARAKLRDALVAVEGEDAFEGVQRFLDAVHTLSSERRLSRFMYLARKS